MKNLTCSIRTGATIAAVLLTLTPAMGQTTYNQVTVNAFTPGANQVEKSATIAPNISITFSNLVKEAFATNSGGVFDFPTAVTTGTTLFRGTYAGGAKRLHITSSSGMQNTTSGGGTFTPVSGANATTTSANSSDFTWTIGGIFDVASSNLIVTESVSAIGVVVLARSDPGYPLDVRATLTFTDGSTQAVTATIGNPRGSDETFYGFTAPDTLGISQLRLQSFVQGTTTPVANRIGLDDFGFITRPAFIPPAPVVENLTPANYAISLAENGIQFQVRSYVYLDPTNIVLTLNSNNVTSQATITGNSTNRSVSYTNLLPNQEYTMVITATNSAGNVSVTQTFYTTTNSFVLYDSQSFTNDTLYPVGPLQAVTDGRATWTPNAAEPATIADVGDPQGKILQRQNTGLSRADFLDFPPVSSGTMTVEFDALASTTTGRTFDICLQPLGGAGTVMGPFLAWGEVSGKLAYFDNATWLPIADLQSGWHHYKILNYLSGPAAGRYDVEVDGTVVAQRLLWRNVGAGAALSRFRIQSQNTGPFFEYGDVDNLVITAGPPDLNAILSPTILNVAPFNHAIISPLAGVQFEVTALQAINSNNVSMLLNSNAASLTVTNSATNHLFGSYNQLTNGNYNAAITATNAVGSTTTTVSFIATDEAWLLHPGNGWVEPWEWTTGQPELRFLNPIDGAGPYIHLDAAGTIRNFMREYQVGAVDINQSHFIHWKFRLSEPDFASNFTSFNDRVHFFARTAARLNGGTDASDSWAISATGTEQTPGSGISAGQMFYIFDNRDGSGNYNLTNLVNSGVQLLPDHIYSFTLLVSPQDKTYTVTIVDETGSVSFSSSAPHRFRDLSPSNHPFLHFGVQTALSGTVRTFDLDSVFVAQGPLGVTLLNPIRTGSNFSFSFLSQSGMNHTAQYLGDLTTTNWTSLITLPGDGSTKNITHTNAPSGPLFYRVRTSLP